ncbi:MAG: hypothetical protein H0W65_10735 [Sphingomonas sp.]|uniref:hypothetical protein n=1 Tax=Sphingomonas sp. TaxID=28214 RepID=UPI0017BBBFAD|nr:hypothetical protein [Sphingomonas sp.]MBA3668179.1 hypothetical protein [Sphingomonas sp.]
MSARGFGAVLSAGAVAGAALGFYLVSLKVASERAQLEDVETTIAMTQRDIRLLQTELGTRGRLAQLERWNVKFIRLSAPSVDQFVDGGFQLATLVKPEQRPMIGAPVVLASARIDPNLARSQIGDDGDAAMPSTTAMPPPARPISEMVHIASYSAPPRLGPTAPAASVFSKAAAPAKTGAVIGAGVKPRKPAVATKQVKSATADPLAPVSSATSAKAASLAVRGGGSAHAANAKDSGSD